MGWRGTEKAERKGEWLETWLRGYAGLAVWAAELMYIATLEPIVKKTSSYFSDK